MNERSDAKRFRVIEGDPEFPNDGDTCWYWDTQRPVGPAEREKPEWPFIAVQVHCGKDPNLFVRVGGLRLLFTDQAEYYAVCPQCYFLFHDMQWSGSTRSPNWQSDSARYLTFHQEEKGWCQFCDPIFGNGGWAR